MDNSLTREELQKQLSESASPFKVDDHHFNEDMVEVVRCKKCVHHAYPEERIVWCKRQRVYMPVNGYCSYGNRKADSK